MIGTNLGSLFNMTRQVIEGMRARKFGRIINISSINGQKGQMGQVNYSAAKAGEIGFTKALAQEKRQGRHHRQRDLPRLYRHRDGARRCRKEVLEKSILPQIPVGRLGEPEEIARCGGVPRLGSMPASSPVRRSPPMAASNGVRLASQPLICQNGGGPRFADCMSRLETG